MLGAVAAMAEVLLHEERHRECSWELVLWLLQHYREASDTSVVTKVRICTRLGVAAGVCLCECHKALGSWGVPGGAEKPLEKEQGE